MSKLLILKWRKTILTALSLILIQAAAADEPPFPDEDPSLWGEEEKVYAATKFITHLKQAPAVASVITAQQIENMGARTLVDVLEHVPGIGISIDRAIGIYAVETRGFKSDYSNQVLVLIDGHSVNDVYYSSATFDYFDYPVNLIKRLEVIRSPGSALHGTGAFGAVINIITKENTGIDSSEWIFAGGTPGYSQAGTVLNRNFGDLRIRGFLNYMRSDSHDLFVEQDRYGQSGYTLDDMSRYDLNINLDYLDFSSTFSFLKRESGPYIGVLDTLNDETIQRAYYGYADLRYKKWISEDVQINFKGYYDRKLYRTNWEIIPAEANPFFSGSMYGRPHGDMRATGAEAQLDYTLSDENLLTIGAAYEERKIEEATHVTNFDPTTPNPDTPVVIPLGSLQDVSDWGNFSALGSQYISALYVQNIWYMTPNMTWTVGARYDNYSDFGGTLNPRIAMVWNRSDRTSVKLLYGTAFRAPNFVELFITNNPTVEGNKDLQPEKNKTYELSISHDFNRTFSGELNLFHTEITDLITQTTTGETPEMYINRGGLETQGFEVELKANFSPENYAYVNYTFQDPRDSETDDLLSGITRHRANAGLNLFYNNHINFNTNINMAGRRSRGPSDPRDPLPKYAIVDAGVIFKNYRPGMQMQLTVHNLFDKTYYDPDETMVVFSDYPRQERNFTLGVKLEY